MLRCRGYKGCDTQHKGARKSGGDASKRRESEQEGDCSSENTHAMFIIKTKIILLQSQCSFRTKLGENIV